MPFTSLIASELPQDEQMVVIVVGAEKKKYHVHRGLLTFHSNYFDNALNKHEWTEAQDRIVTLEDIESKTCKLASMRTSECSVFVLTVVSS